MKEFAANVDLTGTSVSAKEKNDKFHECVDPTENARQIAEIGNMLEDDIKNLFEISGLTNDQVLNSVPGKELAAQLGPSVLLSTRDAFFVESLADRFTVNYGDLIYYTRERDVPIGVISASISDGGAPMATNPLITESGYHTPIQVIPNRLVMSFEYDDPRLAESQASSRAKAIEYARYRIRKATQDVVVTAWTAGHYTSGSPFPAAMKYDFPTGRTCPTNNEIDCTANSGAFTLDSIRLFSNYFDELGFQGQKILFVSPAKWNSIKSWVSLSVRSDAGNVLAEQVLTLSADTIKIFDVLVVKKWQVPDSTGWGMVQRDNTGAPTLGVYQFGKVQTLPSSNVQPTRAKFDVYIPGLCGVLHNPLATAFVKFA